MPSTTTSRSEIPLVSIVCPVFNEEDCIPLFFSRLQTVVQGLEDRYRFELIFTNNGSTDRSVARILEIREKHPWVQLITLSRNFGYQASLLSGLSNAMGDLLVIIDVDCEDPPELIPVFLKGWEEGNDVVYGERINRPEAWWLKAARKLFYRLTRSIADSDFILDMAEFSLFTKRVRDVLCSNRSTFPFLRNEIAYAGFPRKAIPFTRLQRVHGQTHYRLLAMTQFAITGILSSSTFPLRAVAYFGIPIGAIDLGIALSRLASPYPEDLAPFFLLNLSFVVVALGFASIYIGRIYKDGVGRPRFIIDQDTTYLNEHSAHDDVQGVRRLHAEIRHGTVPGTSLFPDP
jgi:glycosyltransferase involved in cell wall biosynthesis